MIAGKTKTAHTLAAIVYDGSFDVDALVRQFAAELSLSGVRVGGVVQLPFEQDACGCSMRVRDLASGDVIAINQKLGAGSTSCSLDPGGLAAASIRIRRAIDDGCDLVIVSRFGRQEAAGRGFRDELAHACTSGLPVLTAVSRELVRPWQDFTGGLGELIDGRADALRLWWGGLRATAGQTAGADAAPH